MHVIVSTLPHAYLKPPGVWGQLAVGRGSIRNEDGLREFAPAGSRHPAAEAEEVHQLFTVRPTSPITVIDAKSTRSAVNRTHSGARINVVGSPALTFQPQSRLSASTGSRQTWLGSKLSSGWVSLGLAGSHFENIWSMVGWIRSVGSIMSVS